MASSAKAQESPARKFGPEVVAKAEKHLEGAGLRRSGKVIQSAETTTIARAISGLVRKKRELRLVFQEWKKVETQLGLIREELQRLNIVNGELNMQLARVVTTVDNNRLVGQINANIARSKLLSTQRDLAKQQMAEKRAALNKEESAYAETVLAIRKDYESLREQLARQLTTPEVKIALRVMHTNFGSPDATTAEDVLSSLDKRIQRIEQEIFSESIPMEVDRGSLYVTVVVGTKPTRMVVDSGATMVSLPQSTAMELGIVVPPDARVMRLVLADGRSIPARGVTLPMVRVGKFEAENVEAAVLDASATDAEPLLGMSYLGNFKFEVDVAEKSLKMLRVESQ